MNEGETLVNQTRPTSISNTNTTNQRRKTAELLMPFQKMTLRVIFQSIGSSIGKNPWAYLIVTVLLLLPSFGLIGLKLRDNVRDGYCPKYSRARAENEAFRWFLGSEGDPVMTSILVLAKDNGSMHRLEYIEEAVRQWDFISQNISAQTSDGEVRFENFCGHYCQSNEPVRMFKNALARKTAQPTTPGYYLTYPFATIMNQLLHLERNLFGTIVDEKISTDISILEMMDDNNTNITNIEYTKIISFSVMTEVKTLEDFERLGKWELEIFDYCQEYTANPENFLEIHVLSAEIVDVEMNKDAQKMTPYFIVGFSAMLLFVISTVYLSAYYYGFANYRMIFIGISCALVPTFAITTTLGLNNISGFRTNSPLLIMPFLINGIGVNDAFLTLHAWVRQDPTQSSSEKMRRVLHEVGPSITTTTLTNVVTFLIGWFSPTEEMSIFCLGCGIALLLAYVFTIVFFCPLLVLVLKKRVHEPVTNTKRMDKLLDIYCKIICSKITCAILIIGWIVYATFGTLGTIGLESKLDTAKILPLDTPVRKPNRLIEEYVWKEFYPVTIMINTPFDITNAKQVEEFEKLVGDFENSPKCRGKLYTISWLRDYIHFFWDTNKNDFDYDADSTEEGTKPTSLDFTYLEKFVENPHYKHHKGTIKIDLNEKVPLRRFAITFVYHNSTSWEDRIDAQLEWRAIVDSYPALNASVWNVNAMFVDQMLSLKPLAIQNAIITLLCMAIVCLLFIQNPVSVITATLAILSISLGVTGYLSFWQLDLDPVSLCANLVAIGMAVDFVAHTTYHYQVDHYEDARGNVIQLNTPQLRVKNTLINISWPMIQSAFSTLLCILPLVHLQNYLPLVFVKTIALVVIFGLYHGLVFLPAILAQIPLSWFRFNLNHLLGVTNSSPNSPLSQEMTPLGPNSNSD
ncbi:unnamed protein product [Caenorhabditis angaria]|uniref:SSD domain-containing protein n=1 Tax=Caenorhabditis angaria TaxID=860376 RepID=A0A9P1I402_9PELO|nr:unnamed protein product [Caenorhabditis angaria]